MNIKVLGTAAGGGVPQWNCACKNCCDAREGRAPRRSVATVAVCADDDRWLLINASADISRQIALTPALRPKAPRRSPIAAIALTDANVDHVAGILEFRQANNLAIYSSELVRNTLCASPMFAQFAQGAKQWRTFANQPSSRVTVVEAPHLTVDACITPGLLPSYAGGHQEEGATTAFIVEHNAKRFVYAPIFLSIGEKLKAELERADAALLDGTCWSDKELIELGLGERRSREMGHAPIAGPGGSLAQLGNVRAQHRYYTHINNSNPILDVISPQSRELAEAGWVVASDGLEIDL